MVGTLTPTLYEKTETEFTSNGLGRLADCTKCEVTEERNGMYELVLQYPVNGKMFNELQIGRYIYANHDESRSPEPFQIYRLERPLEGFITVHAWHISYALNFITVEPFVAYSASAALTGIVSHSMNTNPFTFWTDKTGLGVFGIDRPATVRSILGGMQGSILDVFGGGEYEFTGTLVKLYASRGANNGVSIRYGKNLTKLDQQIDASNVCNSVVPYWTNGEDTVASPNIITRTGETADRVIPLDLSSYFTEAPAVEDLDLWAQDIIDNSQTYVLKENLKIDFVALWQTEEYKDVANLQRVKLCDTVNIYYAKMGVNVTAKVIKVVYDSLRERYTSIELGEPQTSLAQQIQESIVTPAVADKPSTTMMSEAINHATELISGGFGGYIKYKYLSDGTPSEMLIMDAASESTAQNIIRLNQNGIGFSNDGGATYTSAWTIDGQFVADFITTGTLNANVIRAGIIQDADGDNYWDLEGGEFVTQKGQIADFNIDAAGLTNGTVGADSNGTTLNSFRWASTYYQLINGLYYTLITEMGRDGLFLGIAPAGSPLTSAIRFHLVCSTDPNNVRCLEFRVGSTTYARLYREADHGNPWVFFKKVNFASDITLSGDLIAHGTTTVLSDPTDFLTAQTGYTIESASLAIWGKVAQLVLNFSATSAITIPAYGNISNFVPAVLKSGYRPANSAAFGSYGDFNGASGAIETNGNVKVCSFPATGSASTQAAGTTFVVIATYLLA